MNKLSYIAILVLQTIGLSSQTSGTLTFTFTAEPHNGKYGSDHAIAVWIENNAAAFVVTNLRQSKNSHVINNHLTSWKAKSNLNITDATTGATLKSYTTPITIKWNGTDASKAIVPDGDYKIWIEESWDDGTPGKTTSSFVFSKSGTGVHLTPANTANFSNIVLDWVPGNTSLPEPENSIGMYIYPNPTAGVLNISYGKNIEFTVTLSNIIGEKILESNVGSNENGLKSLNLGKYNNGIYFVTVRNKFKETMASYKVVLSK